MKKAILAGLAVLTLSGTAFAGDICENFAGHWVGTFTLKNPADCNEYGGCTHAVEADMTRLSKTLFQVDLKPSKGVGGVFNMTCENGILNSPTYPGNTMTSVCNDDNHCVINYDDPRQTAKVEK